MSAAQLVEDADEGRGDLLLRLHGDERLENVNQQAVVCLDVLKTEEASRFRAC